jgi:hypothetical protein
LFLPLLPFLSPPPPPPPPAQLITGAEAHRH